MTVRYEINGDSSGATDYSIFANDVRYGPVKGKQSVTGAEGTVIEDTETSGLAFHFKSYMPDSVMVFVNWTGKDGTIERNWYKLNSAEFLASMSKLLEQVDKYAGKGG